MSAAKFEGEKNNGERMYAFRSTGVQLNEVGVEALREKIQEVDMVQHVTTGARGANIRTLDARYWDQIERSLDDIFRIIEDNTEYHK